jgi:hypothetical protein
MIASGGCIQISSQEHSCGNKTLGVNYIERTYLWLDGPLTTRYDATVHFFGWHEGYGGLTEYELNENIQFACNRTPDSFSPQYSTYNISTY